MKDPSSSKELKEIKLEISNLTKSVKSLSSQFARMNSILIQLLTNLDLDYLEDETFDFVQNEKLLSRIKELDPNNDPQSFQ